MRKPNEIEAAILGLIVGFILLAILHHYGIVDAFYWRP